MYVEGQVIAALSALEAQCFLEVLDRRGRVAGGGAADDVSRPPACTGRRRGDARSSGGLCGLTRFALGSVVGKC